MPWPGILLFWGAFGVYALAASRTLRLRGGGVLIWVFAVAMRLVLLPLTPELSADVYRQLWDGHIQLSGFNPYAWVPADSALAGARTPWFALITDPTAHTVYPPFAQIAFAAIAAAGATVLQAKLLWVGLDLATAWLLGKVARFTGRSRRLTQLLYLWSPLLVVEVAWNAHLEPLGLFALVLVILLARAPLASGAAGALSALTRVAPLAALPALVRRLGWRFLAGFVVMAAALHLPYAGAGTRLYDGLLAFLGGERFMEGPFRLLEAVVPDGTFALWAAGLVVLAVALWAAVSRFRPERALYWVLGAGLLLTPVLHPWYVLWMLPLAALRLGRAWILMSGLVFTVYAGLPADPVAGSWEQPLWVRLLIWLPVLALLAVEGGRMWRERFAGHPAVAES